MPILSPRYVDELNYVLYRQDFILALELSLKLDRKMAFVAGDYCKKLGNVAISTVFFNRFYQTYEEIEDNEE